MLIVIQVMATFIVIGMTFIPIGLSHLSASENVMLQYITLFFVEKQMYKYLKKLH